MRVQRGWRGTTVAWMALAGFAVVMITFIGVNYLVSWFQLDSMHAYAGDMPGILGFGIFGVILALLLGGIAVSEARRRRRAAADGRATRCARLKPPRRSNRPGERARCASPPHGGLAVSPGVAAPGPRRLVWPSAQSASSARRLRVPCPTQSFCPRSVRLALARTRCCCRLHGRYDDYAAWLVKSRLALYLEQLPLITVLPDGGNFWWSNVNASCGMRTCS